MHHHMRMRPHVWWDEDPLTLSPRVVLVNAMEGSSVHPDIHSHVPTLWIAAQDILTMDSLIWPGGGRTDHRVAAERRAHTFGKRDHPSRAAFLLRHLHALASRAHTERRSAFERSRR